MPPTAALLRLPGFVAAPCLLGMFNAGGRPDNGGSPRRGRSHVNPAYLGRRAAAPSATAAGTTTAATSAADGAAGDDGLPSGTIAFIGAGNMGRALIKGLIARGKAGSEVVATDRYQPMLDALRGTLPDSSLGLSNTDAVSDASVVVLCVKPQHIAGVIGEIAPSLRPDAALVSIAAAVPLDALHAALDSAGGKAAVVRAMPNIGAQAGAGATGLCVREGSVPKVVEQVFAASGTVVSLEEKLLPALTGVSGCGIAYGLMLAEALSDAGVRHGLPRATARALAAGTLAGAGAVALNRSDTHFAQLRNEIESPGGVTVAATAALEKAGFRAAALGAVDAALERMSEMEK